MTYESTGEVRVPHIGDWFLTWSKPGFSHGEHAVRLCKSDVYSAAADFLDERRVIMRPVEEQ